MQDKGSAVGVKVPRVLLPAAGTDLTRWAAVACDQYTSQPEYWQKVEQLVGDAPSAYRLTLPEAFLNTPEEEKRMQNIRARMEEYLTDGVLRELPEGFVLVQRQAEGKTRRGLVMALDLERYDYHKGSVSLIRATEGTIEERIPPRLRIRAGAPLELPHILVLIDDPGRTVIEPLAARCEEFPLLYDTDLMLGGGHITGRFVTGEEETGAVLDALAALASPEAFEAKYGRPDPLLFAMGDGNHSFATAKAHWESVKAGLSPEERRDHPARFALVEVENVHDEGIVFEPIHRVLFGMSGEALLPKLLETIRMQNGSARLCTREEAASAPDGAHSLPFVYGETEGCILVDAPALQLEVGTLQAALDELCKALPVTPDYIHGADVVRQLARQADTVGFLLPPMAKSSLFPTVIYDGSLPRKTFSMGEANEKRFYMESRRITL